MQLTKLEINGFKSFAKKTELVFEQGITGILGPNGCGKSNIADAFRFVLGEQSARALRGKKVEDFIFGGTEKRKPLSYCEVTMNFDNSDGSLASPYREIAVTRRAYRSGESEYYINKNACRLKDIQELFRDTGIGKDGYSIIGQGRVSDILSDRSNERRIVFEEAAGVMKYRTRKEEAERKLQNTEKNLVRLEDILRELESRIEPLHEQSEKAITYLKMREELRDIELNLFTYQYDKSSERIDQLRGNVAQLEKEILSASAEEEDYAATCASEESAERALSAAISETSQKLIALSASVESQSGDIRLINERIGALYREIEQIKADSVSLTEQKIVNTDRIRELTEAAALSENDSASLKEELDKANGAFSGLEKEIESREAALEEAKNAMMAAMNRLADTKSRVSRLEAMRESLNGRLGSIAGERSELLTEGQKLSDELKELNDAVGLIESDIEEQNKRLSEQITAGNRIEASIRSDSAQLRKTEDEINSIASRRKVLEEMKRAHEGYYASVRRLLNDAERDPELNKRIHGVVAELISVPKEYECAVEMSLGAALQNIIVPTEQDAKTVIEYLRRKDYGRATLLPVSAMRPRLLTSEERNYINVPGCFGIASDLVSCSPAFRGVIENLLGRTVIVRNIDTGILINKKARSAFRIATLAGDILNPGGSMTGGSVQKREFSLLGREREIEELAGKREKIIKDAEQLNRAITASKEKLTGISEQISSINATLQKLSIALASQKEKADITEKIAQKNTDALSKLVLEEEQIRDSISDIETQFADAAAQETSINADSAVTNEDIRRAQTELTALRQKLQTANDELAAIRVRSVAAAKEQDACEAQIERLNSENNTIESRLSSFESTIAGKYEDIKSLQTELESSTSAANIDKDRANSLNDELRTMETERAAHLRLLDDARERRENLSAQIDELKERLHKNELNLNKVQIDLQNLCDRIWQDYELTYENALAYRRQMPITQMHIRTDELRKNIKALGEVNTSAVDDYRSVKERFEDLSAQCTDLHKAQDDLNELIGSLTDTMEREFSERFEQIRQNFTVTFRELFGGGRAELVLADKNDVLNSQIEIIAQPPGKKLQLLTLLSGGEQALTAIALLFAILRLKPAAFCILDEIDTSLDEANVDCFANYLKGYADGTQFIVITHRKGSMAVCDSLYGVSMEEKGVSSIVSAKFD